MRVHKGYGGRELRKTLAHLLVLNKGAPEWWTSCFLFHFSTGETLRNHLRKASYYVSRNMAKRLLCLA